MISDLYSFIRSHISISLRALDFPSNYQQNKPLNIRTDRQTRLHRQNFSFIMLDFPIGMKISLYCNITTLIKIHINLSFMKECKRYLIAPFIIHVIRHKNKIFVSPWKIIHSHVSEKCTKHKYFKLSYNDIGIGIKQIFLGVKF